MKIGEWAKGRWPEIIERLIGPEFSNTRKNQPCPRGEGTDRFRFSNKNDCGNYFCACSQGEKDGFELLMCYHGWDFKRAKEEVENIIGKCPSDGEDFKPKETWAKRLRGEAIKTKRSAYLEDRGLEIPGILDWHPRLAYFDHDGKKLGEWPAMLSPVVRGEKFLTYHVTYLQDGGKAPLDPCRKILDPARGGYCPLYPADGETLGVAEGIETSIAAKILSGIPVWATLNTALMTAFEPPAHIKRVVIFGDNDKNFAGHAAAYSLAHKQFQKGREVELRFPKEPGTDWNDVLLGETHG